jgi:hypothetical protein
MSGVQHDLNPQALNIRHQFRNSESDVTKGYRYIS